MTVSTRHYCLHGRVAFTKAGYVLALMSEYSLFEVVVGRRQTKKFVSGSRYGEKQVKQENLLEGSITCGLTPGCNDGS